MKPSLDKRRGAAVAPFISSAALLFLGPPRLDCSMIGSKVIVENISRVPLRAHIRVIYLYRGAVMAAYAQG